LLRFARNDTMDRIPMRLHLAGHLAWYESQKRSHVEISAPRSTLLIDLLRDLGIPLGEIAIAVVNGVAVEPKTIRVSDTDRVDLFPPVGGG
jgi:sulfur carrier protein ThiS